jgi:phenylacetaldehyde dehydrogenase
MTIRETIMRDPGVKTGIEALSDKSRQFIATPKKLLIGGNWVPAASGKTFEVYDPANGQVIAQAAEGEKIDIDLAVDAAHKAFTSGPWPKLTPSERGKLVWKIGDLILKYADELAELESIDNGKPVTYARALDVQLSAEAFHYMAGWATKIEGNTMPLSFNLMPGTSFHAFTVRQPIGVVGQIIPWNFPLLMAAWKLAPALTTGNTIVLKPAEETPLTALRLGEILLEAGIPPGVVNIVTGFGETAGAAMVANRIVKKIAFTGSTEVGKIIVKAAAGDLKRISLELGGKSPNIILDDADLDAAIAGAANAIFFNQGQICTAGSRLFIQEKVFDQVVAGISAAASNLKIGPGLDPTSQIGPLVSQTQFNRVSGHLKGGEEQGARAAIGGKRWGNEGYFVEPTVLVSVSSEMNVYKEEIFGPVVAAMPFKDVDDLLIARANDSIYGLAAGLWTNDLAKAHQISSKLDAGSVWVNCYNVLDPAMPFGGFKQSGWGREQGHAVIEHYTEMKSVCMAYPTV